MNSLASPSYASFPSAESSEYRIDISGVDVDVMTGSIASYVVARMLPLAVLFDEEEVDCVPLTAVAGS